MKKFLILIFFFTTTAFSMSANEIAQKSYHLSAGKTLRATIKMDMLKNGKKTTIDLEMLQQNNSGNKKILLRTCSPKNKLGQGLLTINNTHKQNYFWFQHVNKKAPNKISAKDAKNSFLGSDFAFEDFSKWSMSQNKFSRMKDESKHYIIKLESKLAKGAHKYKVLWIRKDNYMVQKVEYYDKKDDIYKKLVVNIIKKTQGFWTVQKMRMDNLKTKGSTTLTYSNIEYNTNIDFTLFDHKKIKTKCSN